MAGKLLCPHCEARFPSSSLAAGTRARCPECGGVFRIPQRATADVPRSEDEDEDRPRRKKRRAQGGKGLLVGLLLGGAGLLVLAVVLVLGFSLGWFRESGPVPDPGPAPGSVVGEWPLVPGERPKPRLPSKEIQAGYSKVRMEQAPVAEVEKMLGPAREVPLAEVERLFDHVAFRKQIFERFVKHRQDLKVQRWLTWERDGSVLILGLSRARSGKMGVSMLGMWSEGNRAFFDMSPHLHPVDLQ